jgi:hypothetical protein
MATKREMLKACKSARDAVNERLAQLNMQIASEVENLQRINELESGLQNGVYTSDELADELSDIEEGDLDRTF